MKLWRMGRTLCLALMLISLTGCALLRQPSALIQQPNMTKENAQLLHNVSRFLPDGARLVTPAYSTITGRIMRFTLQQGTEGQSAFFYETASGETYFIILTSVDGSWKRIYNQSMGVGHDIKLAFVNAGPSHDPRLIMTAEHSQQSQLFVLAMQSGKIKKLLSTSFSGWIRGYFDNQLQTHLAFIQADSRPGQTQFRDYILSAQRDPLLNIRHAVVGSADSYSLLHRLGIFMLNPGINQLTTQGNFVTDSTYSHSSFAASSAFSLVHSTRPAVLFFGAARSSVRMMSHLMRQPFYPISQGLPSERYYNSIHHFFIDFPVNIAGDLSLAEETDTHILFTRKESGTSYLSVYWIPKLQWTRGTYIDWIRLGASDQFVFAAPPAYEQETRGIHFGVYNQLENY
ncbi:MAG: hypothetical protein ABF586_11795 [Sporolactobacillus sp.]